MAESLTRHGQPANYNATPATRADGAASALEVDASGNLKVAMSSDIQIGAVEIKDGTTDARATVNAANTARTTATVVQAVQQVSAAGAVDTLTTLTTLTGGGVAANAADSGNPVKVGGKYVAAGVTLDDGDRGDVAMDSKSNVLVSLNTLISGEDQTNDVLKTEQRFTYHYQAAAAADVVVKATPGFLHGIIIGADVGSAVIEISDHASDGDGAVKIYLAGSTLMTSCGGFVPVNAAFTAGISADITNQTHVTFIFR
jgi:hypothetical protein